MSGKNKKQGLFLSFLSRKPSREELVRKGDLPALTKLLRKQGVDKTLNAPLDHEGNTPLILAARKGSFKVVQWLLAQEGLNMNARNRFGWTALYEAAGTGHRHILDRLVQAGADPTIPATSWPRHTPSQMARQMGWNACVDVLVKAEKMWAERKREDRETDREETKEEEVMGLSEHPALSGTVGGDEKTTAELSSSTGTKPAAPGTRKEKEVAARSLPSSTTRPVSESGGSTEKFDSSTAGPSSPPSSPSSFTFSSSSSSPLSSGAARLAGPTGVASSKTSSNHVEATQTVSPAPPTTPSKKTDLPACLRWQVEEGVGEGGHEGRWGAWEEAEEDWLEVHPAVFSKRGPRVGRRRREGGGAGSWVLGCLRRNKTLMNLATGRTGERIKARAGSRRNPRWVVQKE